MLAGCRQECAQPATPQACDGNTAQPRECHLGAVCSSGLQDEPCGVHTSISTPAFQMGPAGDKTTTHGQARQASDEVATLRQRGGGDTDVLRLLHLGTSLDATSLLDGSCASTTHLSLEQQDQRTETKRMPGSELPGKVCSHCSFS